INAAKVVSGLVLMAPCLLADSREFWLTLCGLAPPQSLQSATLQALSAQNRDARHGLLDTAQTATVLSDADASALYLASPCVAAQLPDEFVDLAQPGSAYRMSFRFEAA